MDRKLLRSIINNYDGGPVGLKTIAISVTEETDTLEEMGPACPAEAVR